MVSTQPNFMCVQVVNLFNNRKSCALPYLNNLSFNFNEKRV